MESKGQLHATGTFLRSPMRHSACCFAFAFLFVCTACGHRSSAIEVLESVSTSIEVNRSELREERWGNDGGG